MDIRAKLQFILSAVEVFTATEVPSAGGQTFSHNGFNQSIQLTGTSSPVVDALYAEELTGPQSLDLTALSRTNRDDLDATGKKLQAMLVNNLSSTSDLVISDGGANPYSINGTADVTIPAGDGTNTPSLMLFFPQALDDVAAGAKAIDFTITAGQDFQVLMLFG